MAAVTFETMLADEMATVQSERLVQTALTRWTAERLKDTRLISHLKKCNQFVGIGTIDRRLWLNELERSMEKEQ